jgi:hypothetical protein
MTPEEKEQKQIEKMQRLANLKAFWEAREEAVEFFSTTKAGEKIHAEKLKKFGPDGKKKPKKDKE